MTEQLHWLPFTTRIEFKVLFLVLKSQLGCAPKYLCDQIQPPISASSLRSSQRHDLFMPRVRTTVAHVRSFASIGPSFWNHLPPHFRSFILSAPISSSLSCLTLPFSWNRKELKALLFGLHHEKNYINIYIRYKKPFTKG